MATEFEVRVAHADARYADQAARAALEELDALEQQLSRFIPHSDIAQLNALGWRKPVRVGPAAWDCLRLAEDLRTVTAGAFDVTCGSGAGLGGEPALRFDEVTLCVMTAGRGVQVDLGGLGKGYAVDRLLSVLADWGIASALVHAGGSSVVAMGSPDDTASGWPVGLEDPRDGSTVLERLGLHNRALGASGIRRHGPHIIDPRTGEPATKRLAAWSLAPSAAEADALATAFMVMDDDAVAGLGRRRDGIAAAVLSADPDRPALVRFGDW